MNKEWTVSRLKNAREELDKKCEESHMRFLKEMEKYADDNIQQIREILSDLSDDDKRILLYDENVIDREKMVIFYSLSRVTLFDEICMAAVIKRMTDR